MGLWLRGVDGGAVRTLMQTGGIRSAGRWKEASPVLSITILVCVSGSMVVCAGGGVHQAD